MLALSPFGIDIPAQVVVLGAITGLSYGLLGVGLTLVYRTSRVLNFAQGQLGILAATFVPFLVFRYHLPVAVSMLLALLGAAVIGLAVERTVIRKLARSSRLLVLVATLGLAQILFVVEGMVPKNRLAGRTFPSLIDATVEIGGVRISGGSLQLLLLAPVIAIVLEAFLRRTRLGLATRACAENDEVARLCGIPVHVVTATAWGMAAALAGAAAILSGPSRPVITTVALGPGLMVRGLAAALLAGFGRLPNVLAAGAALGVLEALVIWNRPTGGVLEIVLLAVVLITIVVRRDLRQRVRGGDELSFALLAGSRPLPDAAARHRRVVFARRGLVTAAIATAALLPLLLDNADRFIVSSTFLLAMTALSLVVLTGYGGQVSLGQFAFVAIGAVVGGRLQSLDYPWLTALLYATIAGAVAAVVVGLPALRIRGVFLAVTTLSFAVALGTWLFRQDWLTEAPDGTSALRGRRPELLGVSFRSELAYCWLCLGALVVTAFIVHHIRRTGLGRVIVGARDNEAGAAAFGVNPAGAKLTAFAISGVIASAAGYLYGSLLQDFTVQPERVFSPEESLALVGIAIVGGVGSVGGVITAALAFRFFDEVSTPLLEDVLNTRAYALITAGALLGTVLQFPGGMAAAAARWRDRAVTRLTGRDPFPGDAPAGGHRPALPPAPVAVDGEPGVASAAGRSRLTAAGITVRYGGIVALDGVDLRVDQGEILALVGPNGAGKTTLFDVLTGRLQPDDGRVLLDGDDVTDLPAHLRARLGVGRTFQQARLFDDLTLTEAIELAQERIERSEAVPSMLGLPPSRRAERHKRQRAAEVLELFGLEPYADRRVVELSTGTRRLAELAAQVASLEPVRPILLLDEPTAGLAQREVEAFAPVLVELRDHLDATVVVIDHDMPVVEAIADRVVVLAAGQVIADDEPSSVREQPGVIAAFLGTDTATVERSNIRSTGAGPARRRSRALATPR